MLQNVRRVFSEEDCGCRAVVGFCESGLAVYRIHQEEVERQKLGEAGFFTCCVGPRLDELSRVKIEVCLIVAFVGSRLKGFKSLLLSVVGLSGTAVCYLFWWDRYFRLAALISESELVFLEHVGYLYRANFLDLAIAATVAFVILGPCEGRGIAAALLKRLRVGAVARPLRKGSDSLDSLSDIPISWRSPS